MNINIPLRNRQVQADQVRSVLEYRQAQMSLQQTENTIRLQVRQAQFALQQNYVGLQAAIAARDYAAQNLDAEQKKLRMGASTSTLVLQASSALTQAESNVLVAATNYEKSKVQLDLSTAETLKRLGIEMSDAEAAKVQHLPKVPGVVPANTNDLTQPNLTPIPVPGVTAPAPGTPTGAAAAGHAAALSRGSPRKREPYRPHRIHEVRCNDRGPSTRGESSRSLRVTGVPVAVHPRRPNGVYAPEPAYFCCSKLPHRLSNDRPNCCETHHVVG